MKIYEVSPEKYNNLILKLRGWIFYRIDNTGRCLIKPFGKYADAIVSKLAIREVGTDEA